MSVEKANSLIEVAKENGWAVKWQILNHDDENIVVEVTRNAEWLEIEWNNRQLAKSAKYRFHEMELVVNNASAAKKILRRMKPDVEQYHKWQRRNRSRKMEDEPVGEEAMPTDYVLPFDPDLDDDVTILKRIRGNTILFKNTKTGEMESVMVPWKVSGGKNGIRVMNIDRENVFYLATSKDGRDFLSFMDMEGRFRAVHLDRLIGVV